MESKETEGEKIDLISQVMEALDELRNRFPEWGNPEVYMSPSRLESFTTEVMDKYRDLVIPEHMKGKIPLCVELEGAPIRSIDVLPRDTIYLYQDSGLMAIVQKGQPTRKLWEESGLIYGRETSLQ